MQGLLDHIFGCSIFWVAWLAGHRWMQFRTPQTRFTSGWILFS